MMIGTWKRWGGIGITVLGAWAGGVSGLGAQLGDGGPDPLAARATEERADRLAHDSGDFSQAAKLYRRAAELRGERDRATVAALLLAGRYAFHAGDEREARSDMERAGELALGFGDVLVAARAFLDAAWLAQAGGDDAGASHLVGRAERLSHSPLIGDADREALLARIEGRGA